MGVEIRRGTWDSFGKGISTSEIVTALRAAMTDGLVTVVTEHRREKVQKVRRAIRDYAVILGMPRAFRTRANFLSGEILIEWNPRFRGTVHDCLLH